MRRLGLVVAAVLPLVAGAAAAQPVQLTNSQMDKVAGGLFEIDRSNSSVTVVDFWFTRGVDIPTPSVLCSSCYLIINTQKLKIVSQFGPAWPNGLIIPQ
jgi:hypothetical protein